MPCPKCKSADLISDSGKCVHCGYQRVDPKCPKCSSPGYTKGQTCLHCNYIDRTAVRMAVAQTPRAVMPPPPRPNPAPPPPGPIVSTTTAFKPAPPRTLPPPPALTLPSTSTTPLRPAP